MSNTKSSGGGPNEAGEAARGNSGESQKKLNSESSDNGVATAANGGSRTNPPRQAGTGEGEKAPTLSRSASEARKKL